MQKAAPHKEFIGAPGADGNCNCNMCPYMALNTLEKLYLSLRDLTPRIEIGEDMRLTALKPLERMLELYGGTAGKGDVGKRSDESREGKELGSTGKYRGSPVT